MLSTDRDGDIRALRAPALRTGQQQLSHAILVKDVKGILGIDALTDIGAHEPACVIA